jgi:hypothetical protein
MATIDKPFSNNTLNVYAYEGFSYRFTNPDLSYNLQPVSNSSGLNPPSLYFTTNGNSNVVFAVSDTANTLTAGREESFTLTTTDASGTLFQASSNKVIVNPGRFLDGSGVPLLGNNYTFYKNETITPIRLVAPSFTLATPTSVPTLPPGLSYSNVASNIFDIVGAPLTTVPTSNYQSIGRQSGGSKIVTTRFNITVSNERLRVDVSGSSMISNMQVGTAISSRVVTAKPPTAGGTIRYTLPQLPDGLVLQDNSGNTVSYSSGFTPTDPSYTVVIAGTPTLTAANAFRDAGATSSGLIYNLTATRTNPLPLLSNVTPFTLAFGETVLFDTPVTTPIYAGVPVVPSEHSFRAKTWFSSNVPISTIFSPDLRSDLSLIFRVEGDYGVADLSTVSVATAGGPSNFTFRAINANAKQRDFPVTINVINDVITFTTVPVDTCFNFVLSRPVNLSLAGYYPSNIQFQAEADSGVPVVLSAPALAGTGLSLSNGTIVGIPTSTKVLTTLSVDAVAIGTPATASVTRQFAILDESFNFVDVCSNNFNFVQNVPITPFQIPVTTLSGRNVIDYTLTGNPAGITINPAGVLSGTCLGDTSGTLTVSTTTGFASGSKSYPFSVLPDNILFTVPKDVWIYTAGDPVDIPVTGVSFSGTAVSNYSFTLPSSYGLTIGSSTGLISGDWTDGIPPNQTLPPSLSFDISASAGSITSSLPATFTVDQLIKNASFVWGGNTFFTQIDSVWSNLAPNMVNKAGAFDIKFRNSNVDGNVVLATARDRIYRSSNYATFVNISFESPTQLCSTLTFEPLTSTWWAAGTNDYDNIHRANILQSDDNGQSWYALNTLSNANGDYILARDSNSITETNPYLSAGIALQIKNGILMVGGLRTLGSTMLRSTDSGFSWVDVSGALGEEVAYFNFDASSTWIATGSSLYTTVDSPVYSANTDTIKYSTDQGLTWSTATGGFNMMGYEIAYGSNSWLATGVSRVASDYIIQLKYSTDGSNWSNADLSANYLFPERNASFTIAPLPLGSIRYDGSNWNVFVQRYDATAMEYVSEIYSHNNTSSLASGWTASTVTSQFSDVSNNADRRFVGFTRPQYLRSSAARNITITLTFSTQIGLGPALTSPTQTSFLCYQYVPITPIQLEADDAYFFIDATELPSGLSFNPLTRQITGKPTEPGSFSTRVYAKNTAGITLTTLAFTIHIPRIVRKQDGAGAYTSLLRQYTEVLAAQSARDNRVLPAQTSRLGEFMSPIPTSVTTQTFNTNCANCGRIDCRTVSSNAIASGGGAENNICDFIDANQGEVFDAGNANTNLLCDN